LLLLLLQQLLLLLFLLPRLQLVQSIPQIFHFLPHLIVPIDEGSEGGSIGRVVDVVVVGDGAKTTIGAASAAGALSIVLRHFALIAFIAI
jgi:hypothetical protein